MPFFVNTLLNNRCFYNKPEEQLVLNTKNSIFFKFAAESWAKNGKLSAVKNNNFVGVVANQMKS